MNKMQETLQEIQKQKAIAQSDAGHDVRTQRFKQGKIRQAKEKLDTLYMEYRRLVQSNAVFIVACGSEADSFAQTASEEYQCFAYEADSFYKSLLSQVPEKVYLNQMASRSFFEHLSAKFEDRAKEIDIIGFMPLVFEAKFKRKVTSVDDALDITMRAMNEKIGAEIVGLDAIEKAANKAVNDNFEGQVIPIVLYTKDATLAQEILTDLPRINKNVFLVSAGKNDKKNLQSTPINGMVEVTKEEVEKTLINIKQNVL